ncbi:MAG: LysM peptidoglycan-binding domain-containing protein [Gammaproteobacteria bacterium]|nr:LysM peptidoglycan-binding domain-containing protein [Gammaproteobacteria bacterium]
MDKTNTSTDEMKLAEALSGDNSGDSTSDAALYSIDEEIKQATIHMEALWNKLASFWPAVKKNPEVVNKIERLWSYLKETENESLVLSYEIEKLISHSLPDTPAPTSAADKTITPENSIETVSPPGTNTDTNAAEIDDLLAEILGESYRLGTKLEQQKTGNHDPATSSRTTYITGSQELDELVASILGEGWEKEDRTAITEHFTPGNTQIESIEESQDTHKEQKIDNTDDDFDLDELVQSILTESETTSHVQPIESVEQPAADTSIDVSDTEHAKIESAHIPVIAEITEPIPSSDFESKTANEKAASNVGPETDHMGEANSADESLDELINQLLHQQSSTPVNEVPETQNEQSPIAGHADTPPRHINESEELAVNIVGKSDESSTNTAKSNTIENQTDAQPFSSITATPGITPVRSKPKTAFASPSQTAQDFETKSENFHHQGSKSRFALASLLLLAILIVATGSWKYFISSDSIRITKPGTDKKTTKTPAMEETKSAFIEPTPITRIPEHKATYSPEQEESVFIQKSVVTTDDDEYRARIEQNESDITIVINEPANEEPTPSYNEETPFYNKETVENTLDNTATPVKKAANKDTLNIKTSVKEKTEPKISSKTRRKIIIHTVVKGDTLWAIAKRYVDNPYRYSELAKLSKLKNPNLIYPGNKVRIIKYSR